MRYIVSALVTLEINEEFEGPARTLIINPPADHPALLELWHWHTEQLLIAARAAGPSDPFFL